MNDLHGYINPHKEFFWDGSNQIYKEVGGLAKIAGYFQRVRNKQKGVLICDNGDTIHGTYPAVRSKGNDLIPLLNALSFDGMTAHWEFAYGPEHLIEFSKKLDYPLLAVNCYEKNSDKLVFPPYEILEKNDLQIAILGVAATIVDKTMPKAFSKGIYLTNGIEELKTHISTLKTEEKVDLIVVLSHMGFPQECHMAKKIDHIDVFLSGHSHNRLYQPTIINDTIIIQSGCHGSFIGRLDLVVKSRKIKEFQHELVVMDENISPDMEMTEEITKLMDPKKEKLAAIVGKTKTALTRDKVMETTMDAFLLEALKDAAGREIAFSNGWRYGAPIVPGPIQENDLWNIIPENPPVSVCEITGEELYLMMEENLERTFSRDPMEQMGGFVKRCSGINVYFKIENPKNERIHEFFVNGKRLDRSKKYKACYVTSQGIPDHFGENKEDLGITAIDALKVYLKKKKNIQVELQNTIVPI
ncbi:MAG: bifunctional metallophosphatase/5'-nucleotidase [Candidatus Heimdallarchaeota archaeon]|nr:bifunctional metallophosphatase/5'-nucleotidase [Candidatus Heimdallarchaeota archaeon]